VTAANRQEYVQLAFRARVSEIAHATLAMRRGLVSVVPRRALQLFTWRELEELCCGTPFVDVDVLREHTQYQGYVESDPVIRNFWSVFRSLSNRDRSAFIQFAWGRSRLPGPRDRWSHTFKLSRHSDYPPEKAMPIAHTCFFTVELPPFPTEAMMRQRIVAVCKHGIGGEFLIA
jgi:hypothetical protein